MATPDQIRARGRWSLVVGAVLAALTLGVVMASGAELVTAELDATVNDVTVEQGTTATFTISLSATGNISAAITSAAPSTARVRTVYSLSSTGVLSSSALSAPFNFFSAGTGCGPQNCDVTWTGRADQVHGGCLDLGQFRHASRHVHDQPQRDSGYDGDLRPERYGGKLDDTTATSITVHVVAPSDTTPPEISYVLTPGSPDGNNGWYRSNVSLVWTVTEPESPGSLVKTGCVNQSITTDQAETTYSCSATSTGGSGGPVSVTIKRDATAPSAVTTLKTPPNGTNGWYTTAPAWRTNGADGLSGLVDDPCQTGTYGGPEGTGLIVSGTCTDKAGNSTSDDSPQFKYDATAPSAALAVTAGALGTNGWYTSDVTVDTDGTDSVSDPTTCTADQHQTTETAGQVFNGSCTNDAGLTTHADPLTVKLDKTAPSVAYTSQDPAANAAGWNKTDVVATFTATDTLSGFIGPSTTKTGTSTSSGEGAAVSVDSPAFVDLAGNEAPAGAASHSFMIDMSAPSAVTTLNTPPNGTNGWYTTAPAWRTNGADGLSGLVDDPCQTGTYGGPEGTGLIVSGTCTDKAGNSTSDDSPQFKYDATAPSAALAVTAGALGTNGWYTSDVTVDTDGTDSVSDPTTCTADQHQTTETAGQVFNGSCTNDAGLTTHADPLTVKLDKTGPSAALSVTAGTPGSNGWYTSDVTVDTDGTDSVSDPTTCTADQHQTTETAGQAFNGSCTNDAGLTTHADPLTVKLDKTGPSAALSVTAGTPGSNGWYTSDVTVDTDGTDSVSDPTTCTADQHQTTETAGQAFNGSCTNDAGLTTHADPLTVKLDKTGPSAALSVTAGTLGGGGWYRSDVTVDTDGTDGVSNPTTCSADQFQTTSTNGEVFTGSCSNDAGLTTSAAPLTVKLDEVDPTLAWNSGPANGGSYYFGSVPAAPACTSIDPLYSGPNGLRRRRLRGRGRPPHDDRDRVRRGREQP